MNGNLSLLGVVHILRILGRIESLEKEGSSNSEDPADLTWSYATAVIIMGIVCVSVYSFHYSLLILG